MKKKGLFSVGALLASLSIVIYILVVSDERKVENSSLSANPDREAPKIGSIKKKASGVNIDKREIRDLNDDASGDSEHRDLSHSELLANFPHDLYLKYLPAALDRDPRAMYLVSESMKGCTWATMPEKGYFEELRQKGLDEKYIVAFEEIAERCSELYVLTDGKNIKELRSAWLSSAAAAGDPIAVLDSRGSERGFSINEDELPNIFRQAFSESQDDEYLHSAVVNYYANFRREFPERAVIFGNDDGRYSLEYLGCELRVSCDVTKEFSEYYISRGELTINDIPNVRSNALKIKKLIDSERWNELGI